MILQIQSRSVKYTVVTRIRPATLFKNRLWCRCFLVSFVKFLKTPFLTEHLRWLLPVISNTFDKSMNTLRTSNEGSASNPSGIYMRKVSKRNTRTRFEICSKLTIKIPERRHRWAGAKTTMSY